MRNSKRLNSKIPPHMVAWLSAEGWTAEELSFVETEGDKYNIDYTQLNSEDYRKVKALLKVAKRIDEQKGERNREYDSKNKLQRKDSPSWFGEGINRDLFK
ncbi:hypothetical protein [Bacillus thuringiensis]|uniref:hypothetical protein n=1 Tax=Bacillus thuringiensis TaxID=1428 RepID=UPI0015D49AEA|nr:hypothetical protein [Bacillus thuringiensis]